VDRVLSSLADIAIVVSIFWLIFQTRSLEQRIDRVERELDISTFD
jgi:hypothetical protein